MPEAPAPAHSEPTVTLIERDRDLVAAVAQLSKEPEIAVDIESNGLFAYRATLCIVQLATPDAVWVIDAKATPMNALAPLLASPDVVKIVHDVAFDARILAESGLVLANVKDTSLAARMLGRTATGLASLLAAELGVTVDKKMQHHDWGARPLDRAAISYLANDVVFLPALAAKLFGEVTERNIGDEIDEETRYRLGQAAASVEAPDERPPFARLKGIEKVSEPDLGILRRIADIREKKARELDVPPYKVIAPDVLFAIARARPKTMAELEKIKGAAQGRRARGLAPEVLRAVADATPLSAEDKAWITRPRPPSSVTRARRTQEQALTKWRRETAKKRGVDEQVVLPGHCLQDLAELTELSLETIAAVPGVGAFRVARDGAALLAALVGRASEPVE